MGAMSLWPETALCIHINRNKPCTEQSAAGMLRLDLEDTDVWLEVVSVL